MQIAANLILENVESNNWTHDAQGREITTVFELHFRFFGIDGFKAFVNASDLDDENNIYCCVESEEGDLHESFESKLEDVQDEVVKACRAFEKKKFERETELIS